MSISAFTRLTAPTLLVAILAPPVAEQPRSGVAPASSAGLNKLGTKYRLAIVAHKPTLPVKTTYGLIEGKEATAEEVARYAPILTFEWNLYPVGLMKRTRLKRIVLCKELSFAEQKRTAIPDFEHDTLYLDVVRGNYAEQYVRKVIHHEHYHIIDLRDDGQLYQDERWARLNPKGFKYGSGGINAQQDSTVSLATAHTPGFLNRYSMTGVEEDKAEMFAHLMVEPKAVQERAAKDGVIRAKVARMKELMAAFCPEMDRKYWDGILAQQQQPR